MSKKDSAGNPKGIFISYRRADSKHAANRIYKTLKWWFGRKNIFMDVHDIPEGVDFVDHIDEQLSSCQAALIIIGQHWLNLRDEETGERRLEDPEDFVRREVLRALDRRDEIRCIPVLLDGADVPRKEDLPNGMEPLSRMNGFRIHDDPDFDDGVKALCKKFNPRPEWFKLIVLAIAILTLLIASFVVWKDPLNIHTGDPYVYIPLDTEYPRQEQSHRNTLGMRFLPIEGLEVLFAVHETKVRYYRTFAHETGQRVYEPEFGRIPGTDEIHKASDNQPITMVTWDDAKAFCDWLTIEERSQGVLRPNQRYRLPTDEEWSIAVGLPPETGNTPEEKSNNPVIEHYPWANRKWPPPLNAGNYGGLESVTEGSPKSIDKTFRDNHPFTGPVGAYPANQFGISDLGGSVWEWCEDLFDGSSNKRVIRGASWNNVYQNRIKSTFRNSDPPQSRFNNVGFRCVLEFEHSD
ncbi:MAG: SUMF1/EgtB/PvdO family nonheme iron enzyme [Verrucomicrobiota bacterium]